MADDNPYRSLAERLFNERVASALPFPDHRRSRELAVRTLGILFPHFTERSFSTAEHVRRELEEIEADCLLILSPMRGALLDSPESIACQFIHRLSGVRELLLSDAHSLYEGDPAAKSVDEVILAYPGFLAMGYYRIAHELSRLGVPLPPRVITEWAHRFTGIDIHPGAVIGRSFAIDHGTGVVIGETTVIGDRVKLYQGVTLGALSVKKELGSQKRHPTVEDGVVIYANATILGGKTVIGHHSIIGGNAWIMESVPPHATVYHNGPASPGR